MPEGTKLFVCLPKFKLEMGKRKVKSFGRLGIFLKHKYWRDFGQVSAILLQEVGRPQVHGYEMNSVSSLCDVSLVSCGDEKVVRVFDCTSSFTDVLESHSVPNKSKLRIPSGTVISKAAAVPALGKVNRIISQPGLESSSNLIEKIFQFFLFRSACKIYLKEGRESFFI